MGAGGRFFLFYFLTDWILFKSTIRHLWGRCVFGTVLYLYAELSGGVCDMALFFGWGTSEIPSEQWESLILVFYFGIIFKIMQQFRSCGLSDSATSLLTDSAPSSSQRHFQEAAYLADNKLFYSKCKVFLHIAASPFTQSIAEPGAACDCSGQEGVLPMLGGKAEVQLAQQSSVYAHA